MDLTISLETLQEGEVICDQIDLANSKNHYTLLVAFGNVVFDEVRVVGRSKLAALYFLRMVQGLGVVLEPGLLAPVNARLHRPGDAYYAMGAVGISVAPEASSGERLDFHDLDAEFARSASDLGASLPARTAPAQTELAVPVDSGPASMPEQSLPVSDGLIARVTRTLKTRFDFSKQSIWVILMTMTYAGFGFRHAWSVENSGRWIGVAFWGALLIACIWGLWRRYVSRQVG